MMLMASSKTIMGEFTASPALKFFGWTATAVMLVAATLMFVFWGQ